MELYTVGDFINSKINNYFVTHIVAIKKLYHVKGGEFLIVFVTILMKM